ncbi:hypothetical protein AB1Y20_023144 [Prymnesium parvum]|uniref:WW domain-containing protein n=1 Tax=Prymnesium parvum TaxID=97485 RepID=A0AB34JDW2_PRYPA
MPSDQSLLDSTSAKELLAAGVPREEVLAGLRAQSASAAGSGAQAYTAPVDSPRGEPPLQITRAPSARLEEPLPEGWEQRFDPTSGRKFYVDFVHQTTSWTRPTAQAQTPCQSVSGMPANLSAASWQLDRAETNLFPTLTPVPMGTAIDEPAPAPSAPPASAAEPPRDSRKGGGFFGGLFGRSKMKDEVAPPPPPVAAAPAEPRVRAAQVAKTRRDELQEACATLCDESAAHHVRIGAASTFNQTIDELRHARIEGTLSSADESALADVSDERTALKLLDALGSTSVPTVQAALCRSLWRLAELEEVRQGVLNAGGLLFVSALLGSPSDEVKQEAALLLLTLCHTAASLEMLASTDAVGPILALLSAGNIQHKRSSLELLERLCNNGCAEAVATAGGTTPLAFELVRVAGVVKGWSGASADVAEGEHMAKQVLACLLLMPEAKLKDAFRAASATPALVALLGTANETLRSQATTLLQGAITEGNASGDDELLHSGGIALLCENLKQSPSDRTQTTAALAKLSSSPLNAAAIAEAAGTVDALLAEVARAAESRTAALLTLANLCRLGALRTPHLHPAAATGALAAACAPDEPEEVRGAALTCVAQAALDRTCREGLAAAGVAAHLVAALHDAAAPPAAAEACHALAQFAADETFRPQLAAWGALRPLCAQMSEAVQPDGRTRAMALSAVANVSFVDAEALAAAGATPHLAEVLFGADAQMLRMALTALSNLLRTAAAAETVVPQLLESGGAFALPTHLQHADADVASQAVTAVMHACAHPPLVAPLAEAGAAPAVVSALRAAHPTAAGPILSALSSMIATESARLAALNAGATHALAALMLGSDDVAMRRAVASTLGALLQGEWRAAYDAAGWPVLLAVLHLGEHPDAPRVLPQVALTAASLVGDDVARQGLLVDLTALCFVAKFLGAAVLDPSAAPDPTLARGLAFAVAAMMRLADEPAAAEGARLAVAMCHAPPLASPLADAAAVPLLVARLRRAPAAPDAARLARAMGALAETEYARAALLSSEAVGALCAALDGAADADSKLAVALALAALLRGDWRPVTLAAGWGPLLTTFAVAASSVSPAMRALADAAAAPMAEALLHPQPAAAAPPAAAAASHAAPPWSSDEPPSKPIRGAQKMLPSDLD